MPVFLSVVVVDVVVLIVVDVVVVVVVDVVVVVHAFIATKEQYFTKSEAC